MKLTARLSAVGDRVKAEPVAASNVAGSVLAVAVGVGLPVTEDLKVGVIGLILGAATLFGRSQVVPTQTLVAGTVLPSLPGQPVEIISPAGASTVIEGSQP